MNNFIFYSPTEFVFGRDTEAQTGVLVQKYGARKITVSYTHLTSKLLTTANA